ncbi:type III restriction-modification system: methylase [Corynebacterium glutamicum ZL-6]|uniref:DNA methyltransferase n=1 Tax=Corynebacterium TaxID=1716 RepID=UPI0008073A32|nr:MULTISPECIES: site-specific DNA-methyltransferase [Corynebacterium]ANR62363.1 type III restriction-modification system: methylase [[Brevibacterium] flavum ZL-1]ANR65368.1 type III restriction-modification system: methylase [Corynebacterium glutamicum ZL-6]PST75723.1 type III restriction-modification system: methylase [Corynebacterium glutamicum ZL-2]
MKFLVDLENLLKKDERFISSDGQLLKPLIRDAAGQLDPLLIRALLDSSDLSDHFFKRVDDIVVFDREKFMWVVNSKEFLPDSYTKYRNRIGLSTDDRSLLASSSEITLIWPYKDCVLEGGQEKEDEERDEIFYNETLAPDEVGRLLAPKAFRNARRYVNGDSEPIDQFSPEDNLIIRGNNLLALSSLLERYEGQVKCIYIDPPYNTGSDSFRYNDRFNHSSWLTFMKNRLDLAKRLLSRDGFILVQCDDNEQAYLKVLMDSVFGEQNFINVISVRTKVGGVTGSSAGKSLKDELEYINLFAKDRSFESANLTPTYVDTDLEEYIQSYKDSGKSWKYTSVLTKLEGRVLLEEDEVRGERLYGYSHVESKSVKAFAKQEGITEGEVYAKFAERIFRTTNAQSSVRARVMGQASQYDFEMIGLEYTPSKGKNASKKIEVLYKGKQQNMMMFLSDAVSMRDGKYVYQDRVGTLWSDIQYNNLAKEGEVSFLNGKKPEALIQRVLDLTTEPGDLVLDFFLGSGSTAAVAHKMGRRYLGVEQLDYITSVTVPRLEKVLAGEQSGISRAQNWQGGGSFVYVELAEQGEKLMVELQEAGSANEVQRVLQKATAQGLLRTSVLPSDLKSNENEFDELSLIDQKNVVAELIDKNRLYVNASGIEDDDLELDLADIAFTKSFYEVGTK